MTRTLENCSIIQKCVKKGIGTPKQWHYLNKCEGYQRGEEDDEPCDACKQCKYYAYREAE